MPKGDCSAQLFEPRRRGCEAHAATSADGAARWWKRIVMCGDDFGMNASIDAGVMKLAALGRLSAVSCLSQGATFAVHGPDLLAFDVDVGLHLNLTQALGNFQQSSFIPLPTLISRAYSGQLDDVWLDVHLTRQFDAFEAVMGRAPDYVDGHQHVHQLPGVLPRLLRLLRHRYGSQTPWLRHTAPGMQNGIPLRQSAQACLVGALGANAIKRVSDRYGWRTNRRLLGVYDRRGGARHYSRLLQRWLSNARDGDLVMCHPAMPGSGDGAASQRVAEYDVLAHPELGDWMRRNGIWVARPL